MKTIAYITLALSVSTLALVQLVRYSTGDRGKMALATISAKADAINQGKSALFSISGQIIESESGRPIPNIRYELIDAINGRLRRATHRLRANESGELHVNDVEPGRYKLIVHADAGSELYGEGVAVEVIDRDINSLTLKLHRGSTIMGKVVIEGATSSSVQQYLTKLSITPVQVEDRTIIAPATKCEADGSFRLVGVPPGLITFSIYDPDRAFSLSQVEKNDIESNAGIKVEAKSLISGVCLILAYGKGSVRGSVRTRTGIALDGTNMRVRLTRASNPDYNVGVAKVEPNGNYYLPGAPPGNYDIELYGAVPSPSSPQRKQILRIKQQVTIIRGKEVTSVFNVSVR